MRPDDVLRFGGRALTSARGRTWLMLLAMAIGVAAVVVLTALGDGARRYVSNEFSSLGTHLLVMLPGRTETSGAAPPLVGGTPRDITLEDVRALQRAREIRLLAPIVVGSAPVSHKQLERESTILGSTAAMLDIRNLELASGRFLPDDDLLHAAPLAVLGAKLKQHLFGNQPALGEWIRLNDRRYRVIGVLKPMGESIGVDIGDVAIIPAASAQALFDTESVFRVLIQADGRERIGQAKAAALAIMKDRHNGEEDVTVITQDALLATFDGIFQTLTFSVVGIAAISLGVAGILIMNVMLVSVSQRTAEVGLLKALGGRERQILWLFLVEAGLLSLAGAALGLLLALAGVWGLGRTLPELPLVVPPWSIAAALLVSLGTGLLFGVLPARRAARLDPVFALNRR